MGDNIYLGDRNGVRTPMQWSPDRNAGFSRANPQKLYLPVNIDPEYHYEALNVETQNNNPHSLLWWMKRMIAQRKQHPAFGRGKMEFLFPGNRKILAFVREFEDEKILVVANLSRFTQCAELDLSKHREAVPVEVFGRNRFPAITEQPYLLSLGPHAFQWFHLQPREHSQESFSVTARAEDIPVLQVDPQEIFGSRDKKRYCQAASCRSCAGGHGSPKNIGRSGKCASMTSSLCRKPWRTSCWSTLNILTVNQKCSLSRFRWQQENRPRQSCGKNFTRSWPR